MQMNYWYAPNNNYQLNERSKLPPELIAAVAAPWRSTNELEAIRAKARSLAHYDVAGAAHDVLVARRQRDSDAAVKALRRGQTSVQEQTDSAAMEAHNAVDKMWNIHLEQLRREASTAVRELQEKHEEAITKMRLDQVAKARDMGIRPERRSKELMDLRRSEAVLVAKNNFHEAHKVKINADELAASEACSAQMAWLLKCHGEQERLMAKQRKELEALRSRLDERLRDVEAARNRDMRKLEHKIKVTASHQQRCFARERNFLDQALNGDMINTTTTRKGRTLADALPTLAQLAAPKHQPQEPGSKSQPAGSSAGQPSSKAAESTPGTGYLAPSSTSRVGVMHAGRSEGPGAAPSVRFAPTPPREAWAATSKGSGAENGASVSGKSDSSSSRSGRGSDSSHANGDHGGSRPSSSVSRSSNASGSRQGSGSESVDGQPSAAPAHGQTSTLDSAKAAETVKGAPSSAADGSGTTAGATGSGSSALTEAALQAMNQASGAGRKPEGPKGASSLQSSSFKSNKPYAGGVSARVIARPVLATKA